MSSTSIPSSLLHDKRKGLIAWRAVNKALSSSAHNDKYSPATVAYLCIPHIAKQPGMKEKWQVGSQGI